MKLYAVQRGKGSVRFLEATWNSNRDSTLHQVQLTNAQTRHYSYTLTRRNVVVANGGF